MSAHGSLIPPPSIRQSSRVAVTNDATTERDDFDLESAVDTMREDYAASKKLGLPLREAPLYAPWGILSQRLFASLVSERQTILAMSQRPVDVMFEEDPSEQIQTTLSDPVPDSAEDMEVDDAQTVPSTPPRRVTRANVNYAESPLSVRSKTKPITDALRKYRIPDVTVALSTRRIMPSRVMKSRRVLSLVEIKPPCDEESRAGEFLKAFEQLRIQARFLLSGEDHFSMHSGIQKLGAIAVVGNYWSYIEIEAKDMERFGSPGQITDTTYSPSQESVSEDDWPSDSFKKLVPGRKRYMRVFGENGKPLVCTMNAGNFIAKRLSEMNEDILVPRV